MRPLPLAVQTLYSELAQSAYLSDTLHGSIFTSRVGGKDYAYVTEKHGAKRSKRYLGRLADPGLEERIAEVRRASDDAKRRRTLVSMLKRARVPAPSLYLGRLLEALSNAGLFGRGMVLAGTAAYQTYSPLIGSVLGAAAMTTQDADLAAATLAVSAKTEGEGLLSILRRADATFKALPGLDRRSPPLRFRAANGFAVDIITTIRRRADEERPVVIPALACGAQPLRFLEYLIEDAIEAVALYGPGVKITVPRPERFAVHKLIVAQARDIGAAKRNKDLAQARELFDALDASMPEALQEALGNARRRGRKWSAHIAASLELIGR